MQKKFLIISLLLFIIVCISSISTCYGIDIDTNSLSTNYNNTNVSNTTNSMNNNTTNTTRQNTTYTDTVVDQSTQDTSYSTIPSGQVTSSLPEAELGLPNILNIILIVVGVLLILLGIAILIRMK